MPLSKPSTKQSSLTSYNPQKSQLSPPINSTRLTRLLVLLTARLFRRMWKGQVLLLPRLICIKYDNGPSGMWEASTLRFIAQNTSIPVPRVYCAVERKGGTYVVMKHIRGEMAGRGWVRRSEASKERILGQLKGFIREMRGLKPPVGREGRVSNVDGGPLFDVRLPGTELEYGPFDDFRAFHRHLREGFEFNEKLPEEIKELIQLHDKIEPPNVFTHGDLSSLNILVRGDDVVGIVDWQTAGWFPYYWEWATAIDVNPQNPFWRDEVEKFVDRPPDDVIKMEHLRQRNFHMFGVGTVV